MITTVRVHRCDIKRKLVFVFVVANRFVFANHCRLRTIPGYSRRDKSNIKTNMLIQPPITPPFWPSFVLSYTVSNVVTLAKVYQIFQSDGIIQVANAGIYAIDAGFGGEAASMQFKPISSEIKVIGFPGHRFQTPIRLFRTGY